MTIKPSISDYLQQNTKTLGSLLSKLNQLKQWNTWLSECLVEEPHLMDHCHVVNLSRHSLIVITDSPHWLTRLRFHIPELLPKLRHYPGLEQLKAICCKAQPRNYHGRYKKAARKRLSLKPETANKVLETAKQVDDQKIRAILEKIASYIEDIS